MMLCNDLGGGMGKWEGGSRGNLSVYTELIYFIV